MRDVKPLPSKKPPSPTEIRGAIEVEVWSLDKKKRKTQIYKAGVGNLEKLVKFK